MDMIENSSVTTPRLYKSCATDVKNVQKMTRNTAVLPLINVSASDFEVEELSKG